MCFINCDSVQPQSQLVVFVFPMEYPLPGPVMALLQQEKASLAPRSYFISSDKKSIKITLVYAKGEQPVVPLCSSLAERKKVRHGCSGKPTSKPATRKVRSKNLSESSSSTNNEQSDSVSHSEMEQICPSPDLTIQTQRRRNRERMSTVDSGRPSSSGTFANDNDAQSEFDSELGDPADEPSFDSINSSDSEKPRTPGREIAVPASSIGPGETPATTRDEMWQTWTRVPRAQNSSGRSISVSVATVGRSVSPSTAFYPKLAPGAGTQRRPRIHEHAAWDGSGNL